MIDFTIDSLLNFTTTISALTGISTGNITYKNMEVNPITGTAYVLVHDASNATGYAVIEVINKNDVILFNVEANNLTYSAITFSNLANSKILDLQWDGTNTLYLSSGVRGFNDGEVGLANIPFNHNSSITGNNRLTNVFKTNFGSAYFDVPLEKLAFNTVNGVDRLMGETVCAPGFSIRVDAIDGSAGLLNVTEDFNRNQNPSLKMISVTQQTALGDVLYLFDLHFGWRFGNRLYRIGSKYLDGSQVTANLHNNNAEYLRDFNGDITVGLTDADIKDISTNFKMMAKFSNYDLLVIDDNDVLKLLSIGTAPVTTSVASFSGSENLSVYPNPASNVINIDLKNNIEIPAFIEMISIDGKINKSFNYSSKIDVSNLAVGNYIIRVLSTEKNVVHQQSIILR